MILIVIKIIKNINNRLTIETELTVIMIMIILNGYNNISN